MGRFQHPYLVYNPARGALAPGDLAGRRVGIRSYSVTTGAWVRGILADDHGVDLDRVTWVTMEEAHVAEFRDPPNVERAPAGKDLATMLREGAIDAAILGEVPAADSPLKPLIPDPAAAARDWQRRHGAIQINHMVVVTEALARAAARRGARSLSPARREQAGRRPAGTGRARHDAVRPGREPAQSRSRNRLRVPAAAHPAAVHGGRALRRRHARPRVALQLRAAAGRLRTRPHVERERRAVFAPARRTRWHIIGRGSFMRILLSNDDGYFAPGLAALAAALDDLGTVTVVAPERDRSGASNSLTLDRPLAVRRSANGFLFVDGTPTDCVHLAVTGLLEALPDIVVSGINLGANMGDDTIYSGTVAAATEGYLLGIPSIAVSLTSKEGRYYETAGAGRARAGRAVRARGRRRNRCCSTSTCPISRARR